MNKNVIKLNKVQLRKTVPKSVKRVLRESIPSHTKNGTGIAYAGHADLWDNGFRGYFVCTPNDGVKYCSTKNDAIKIIKQYYEGGDQEFVINQLGTLGR